MSNLTVKRFCGFAEGVNSGILHFHAEEAVGEVTFPDPETGKPVNVAICQKHLAEFSKITEVELDSEKPGMV